MKKTSKLLSLVLAILVIVSGMSVVASAEVADPVVIADLTPTEYAEVVMSLTTSLSGNAAGYKPTNQWVSINSTRHSSVNATFASMILEYTIPSKEYIETAGLKKSTGNFSQQQNGNGVNIWSVDKGCDLFDKYEDGTYLYDEANTDAEYAYNAFSTLVSAYWPNKSSAEGLTKAYYLKNKSIPTYMTFNQNADAIYTSIKQTGSVTLATGGQTNKNQKWDIGSAKFECILRVTYNNSVIVDYLKTATSAEDLKAKIEAFKTTGLPISDTVNSDAFVLNSVYDTYSDAEKSEICENLYPELANCIAWDDFKTTLYAAMSTKPLMLLDSAVSAGAYAGTFDGVEYNSDNSIVLYGTAIGNLDAYGFVLSQLKDEIEAGQVKVVPELVADDGCFAIRVIGEGITAGTYKAWPFMTVSGATTENTADIETITVAEAAAE